MRLARLVAIMLLAIACSKSESPPAPTPSPTPPAEKPAPQQVQATEIKPAQMMPAPTALVGGGKMAHCPTTVEGASIAIMDIADGVEVTVTAPGDAAKEIATRAKHLAEAAKKDPASAKHTGDGEGGGGLGKCPVMVKDTTVAVADVPNGVKLTIKPAAPAGLAALKTEIRARHAAVTAGPAMPKAPPTP